MNETREEFVRNAATEAQRAGEFKEAAVLNSVRARLKAEKSDINKVVAIVHTQMASALLLGLLAEDIGGLDSLKSLLGLLTATISTGGLEGAVPVIEEELNPEEQAVYAAYKDEFSRELSTAFTKQNARFLEFAEKASALGKLAKK